MSEKRCESLFGSFKEPEIGSMNDLILGAHKACLIYCAAKLNIVDHLYGRKMTSEQLAEITETHHPTLYRFLRGLAALDVLREDDHKHFSVTDFGLQLKSGVDGGAKITALHLLGPLYKAGGNALHSICTGELAFDQMFGMQFFEYMRKQPEYTMEFTSFMEICPPKEMKAMIISSYDFSSFGNIVDVGGGNGDFLIEILKKTTNAKGTVFDLEFLADYANERIGKSGVQDRSSFVSGDFFECVPLDGDCYIMKHIINDWNDEQCLQILANVRKVMKKESKLLIIEMILETGKNAHPSVILDTYLMYVLPGRVRTREEFLSLFEMASMKIKQIYQINSSSYHIIEIELL